MGYLDFKKTAKILVILESCRLKFKKKNTKFWCKNLQNFSTVSKLPQSFAHFPIKNIVHCTWWTRKNCMLSYYTYTTANVAVIRTVDKMSAWEVVDLLPIMIKLVI